MAQGDSPPANIGLVPPETVTSDPAAKFLSAYAKVPPVNAASNVPAIGACSGLGTGGGAGLQSFLTNGLVGELSIFAGKSVSSSWSVALVFPNTPPTLKLFPSQGLGAVTQATVSNTITISGTGATMLGGNSKPYKLAYEPTVSE